MRMVCSRTALLRCLLLVCAALLCVPMTFALDPALGVRQYAHTAWKVRDGFTQGSIQTIAQTRDGYLWLGTNFGLYRFDGVKAVRWTPPSGKELPSAYVISLLAARDGTLWIGTSKGLASWRDGNLQLYAELAGQAIFAILEEKEGTIWIGAISLSGRLCAIQKGNVRCYGEDGSFGQGVSGLYEDSRGNLWAGVVNGLWRWKPGPPKFYALPGEPNGIQGFAEEADGTLLVGTSRGIKRFVDGKIEAYPLPGALPRSDTRRFLRDRDGGLWIGTATQGLAHIHQGRTDVFAQRDGLSSDDAVAIFEDREGDIWIGTTNGLDRFRDFAVATFSVNEGLSNAIVGSVLADRDGSVWLSTYGGLNRWNNGQVTRYDGREGLLNGLAPNSLFQDSHGRIWVSTSRELGYLEGLRFISLRGVAGLIIHGLAEDTRRNLWVATQLNGLFRVSPTSEVQQIPWASLGRKDYASALTADPLHGGLWLGFHDGGIAYFKDGQVRESYTVADGLGE